MNNSTHIYYRLAPSIDVIQLSDGSVLFRSDTLATRIEGEFAKPLLEFIVPLLDGKHSLVDLASKVPDVSEPDLKEHLDALVQAQLLLRSDQPSPAHDEDKQILTPFFAILDAFGISSTDALQQLGQTRIAIIGVEAHGAQLASILAHSGIGSLLLIDPFQTEPANVGLMQVVGREAVGEPRQAALKRALLDKGIKSEILTCNDQTITRDTIMALAAGCKMLVGCFDKGFSATNHWINRASLQHGIPAIYAESKGHTVLVGPLIVPNQTACYMCYRMRNIATDEDFSAAMSYEEFLDKQKHPMLHRRGVFPTSPAYLGSLLALEILKYCLSINQPTLAGKLLEFDSLSLQTRTHTVLRKPDCPVCSVKKNPKRFHPILSDLKLDSKNQTANLVELAPQLVSRRTGIVKDFERIQKDVTEPFYPFIFRCRLANHRFFEAKEQKQLACSGKGMTLQAAVTSALGEAIERYSGMNWDNREIIYARRRDLSAATLDPRDLVLYRPDQYGELPYAPYSDNSVMGWVHAQSLVTNQPVLVPALAIFLSYDVQAPDEFLFPITSNGLAAGPTLLDAILSASFEVIERDAFLISWLNRLPCKRVDPHSHPDADIADLCADYKRRKVEIVLCSLPVDHPCHVFASLGVQKDESDGPAVVVGLGADIDIRRAARKAILEVAQVRPALRRRMRNPETRKRMEQLAVAPHDVTDLEDHDLLYASRARTNSFNFWLDGDLSPVEWKTTDQTPADKLQTLADHFRTSGGDLVYYNLTPPDMEPLGLYTARAIIPGFQPIDFGWKERRLGGKRLYTLAHQLGFVSHDVTIDQLNTDPHPIS